MIELYAVLQTVKISSLKQLFKYFQNGIVSFLFFLYIQILRPIENINIRHQPRTHRPIHLSAISISYNRSATYLNLLCAI